MLTKDLLRVSRAGGGFHPQFVDRSHRPLAARVVGTVQGHVGETKRRLDDALEDLEREADDYKIVRGFATLVEREATFETRSAIDPVRARKTTFEAAEAVGVVTEADRRAALERSAETLGADPDEVSRSLYADLEERQVLAAVDVRWSPDELLDRYNLSLAQTALFDATEVRIRSSDPRALVSAVKRLGLMYEVRKDEGDWEVVVTGPDALFRSTRRYGTRFARLLRTIAKTAEWRLTATIDDRGTERTMRLADDDPIAVPTDEPIAEMTFDSGVEADFAARFESLDLDWELWREPEPLVTGSRVMIPDFAFDYEFADFRVFFEVMGFWTPEYVEKKLEQLADVEDVELLVAVDESLGVSERIEARDHRAITYSGTIRQKDVRDVLRQYEARLVAETASTLPDELRPDADVITIGELASARGVSESAVDDLAFPEHERLGRTLIRPAVLEELGGTIEAGMSLSDAEAVLEGYGISGSSEVLSRLGYEVAWEGLGGGTIRRKG